MATVYCVHHPKVPARWRCEQCHKNFCIACAPKGVRDTTAPPCPICRTELQSLGMGNVIKPFWQRIPRFFLYPAKTTPLLLAFGLAILSLAQMIPLLGIVVSIAIAIYTVRYSYRVLYFTALGNLEPPERDQGGEAANLFWKQIALFVIMIGGVGFLGGLTQSVTVVIAGFVVVMLLFPAAIMTLAVENSLLNAINPLKLLFVATSIGWSYLLLWVMLLLLYGGEGQVMVLLARKLPPGAIAFLSTFLSVYFTVAMYHMMGYVVYQYHEPLGFRALKEYTDSEEGAGHVAQAAGPAPDRVQMLITDGKFDEAEAELIARIKDAPEELGLHDRYNRLILTQDHSDGRGATHADLYIGKLLAQQQRDKALDVYRRGVARWGTLEVKDATDSVALARLAQQRKEAKLALPLLARFAQRFPGHAAIPEAQLLSAQVLSDSLGKDQMALQLVEQLRRAYPEHALRPQMDALHGTLTRLIARQAAKPSA